MKNIETRDGLTIDEFRMFTIDLFDSIVKHRQFIEWIASQYPDDMDFKALANSARNFLKENPILGAEL